MEPSYTILGGDGKKYGPITAEQFRAWARDGRVSGETQVWRSDQPAWVAAAALPELEVATPAAIAVPEPSRATAPVHDAELEARLKSGASWFYWIAAVSLINSIIVMTGKQWGFAIGLGITQVIDHTMANAGTAARATAFTINLIAAGIVAGFGFFAIKKQTWAFIVGLIVLALDTVLTALLQAWISTAFHVWALVSIFMAFKASRALRG